MWSCNVGNNNNNVNESKENERRSLKVEVAKVHHHHHDDHHLLDHHHHYHLLDHHHQDHPRSPPRLPPHSQSPPLPPSRSPPPAPSPPSFDEFLFVQTWPPAFCKVRNTRCINPVPNEFKIHGLWPNKKNSNLEDCTVGEDFDSTKIKKLRRQLELAWPSLKNGFPGDVIGENNKFWSEEWKKHGKCSMIGLTNYFKLALKIYNDINPNLIYILKKAGIKPLLKGVDREIISNAIRAHLNVIPQIRCVLIDNLYYLYEIRVCLTATMKPKFKDCQLE
ncbi:ribonuclease MC-like [Trifolium pratense]|uniref:Uncharacterized protein n=1 Tax=Trifolium pratense TaxID=57577 RepID=A0ACB0KBF1_TRIPR|nr:ribonuclease MC-like [Trifolium pratense]CAJ2654607.1 unnamed protein product [Trifolium pratense]